MRRHLPQAPIWVSSLSAPRAPSASSRTCVCGFTVCPRPPCAKGGASPTSPPAQPHCVSWSRKDRLRTVLRLSDEAESGVNLATTDKIGENAFTGGCLGITTYEGTASHTAERMAEARAILTAHGGTSLGEEPGNSWEHGRFDAPYLRDALLDVGALCETLETATTWGNLANLRSSVTEALTKALVEQGTQPLVMCHNFAHLQDRCFAVLHRRQRADRGSDRSVGTRRKLPLAMRSSPPVARSPITTLSAPITAHG